MKKLFLILSLGLFFVFPTSVVQAQEASQSAQEEDVFDYEKAYKDFVYTTGVYQKAESEYKLARSQYIQAKTLASQTKARDATATLLQTRDDVLTTYLTALRLRLSETEGVSEIEKEGLYSRIDSEIFWYLNHKSTIPSAGTLNDLIGDSNEAKQHYTLTEPLIYEVLATLPSGRVGVQYDRASDILNLLKLKVTEIRSDGEKDTTNIERGLIEIEQKLTRSLDKQVEAQGQIATIPDANSATNRRNTSQSLYASAIATLRESHQFIREASSFMKQIIEQIKQQ